MKNKYLKISLLFLAMVFACDRSLDKINPNNIAAEDYFKTDDQLLKGVNTLYAVSQSVSFVGREWFFVHDLRSDDMKSNGGSLEAARAQLLAGNNDYANPVARDLWHALYIMISRANVVIERAPDATISDDSLHRRIIAEAKFFRGWAYYELFTLWGNVPLTTKQITAIDEYTPTASAATVYAQVVKDLSEAQVDLPAVYSSASDKGRVTAAAAQAMLARAHMFNAKYADAKTELLKIINPTGHAPLYSLTNEYMDNFLEETEYNQESIFEISFMDDANFGWGADGGDGLTSLGESTIRNQEYSPIAWRNLVPSESIANEFESTVTGDAMLDPRFHKSFYFSGDTYNYDADTLTDAQQGGSGSANTTIHGVSMKVAWRKYSLIYKTNSGFFPGGINQRIIRYAEVLLMMAECENELGNDANAISYLNQIRNRPSVSMPNYPIAGRYPCSNQAEIFTAIVHEKRVEMAAEQIRNRDILRWRKNGKLTTDPISYVAANAYKALLPIPQSEMSSNPLAVQNTGY